MKLSIGKFRKVALLISNPFNFTGMLAQLVQSTAFTRQGSLVRAQYIPRVNLKMWGI